MTHLLLISPRGYVVTCISVCESACIVVTDRQAYVTARELSLNAKNPDTEA